MPGDNENAPAGVSAGFTMSIPLPRLSSTGELKPNWVKFKQLWDSYEILTGLKNKEDPVRVATFIQAIGIDFLDVHNNLPYKTEADKQKMEPILKFNGMNMLKVKSMSYMRGIFSTHMFKPMRVWMILLSRSNTMQPIVITVT